MKQRASDHSNLIKNRGVKNGKNDFNVPETSAEVVDTESLKLAQTPIESVTLAQLRANRRCSKRYLDFDVGGSLLVKPTGRASNLMNSHLQDLYNSQILCDLIINVSGKKYNIHKVALTSHSTKYLMAFGNPAETISEIFLQGVSPEVVEQVLEYMYTFRINLNEDNVDLIISICDQLDMKILKENCFQFLGAYNEKNVLLFLIISRRHGFLSLVHKMQHFAADKINAVGLSSQFLLLDIEDVYSILSSSIAHEQVKSEKQLLTIGVRWLRHIESNDSLKAFAPKVLECVALNKVDPEEISHQIKEIPFIFDSSECVIILRKAFRYHAMMSRSNKPFSLENARDLCINAAYSPLIDGQSIILVGGIGCTKECFEAGERVLKYSFGSSNWAKMPSMPLCRSGHGATLVAECLFVIGGYVHSPPSPVPKPTNTVICYNDTLAQWFDVAPMIVKRALFATVTIDDGHIFVFGGETEGFRPTEACEIYSVKADQWTSIESLSVGRLGASACQNNGFIFVVGGIVDDSVVGLVECYDIINKSWSSRALMPRGRCYGSLTKVAGSIFYIGGVGLDKNSTKLRSMVAIFEYNDLRDRWMERAHMPSARHFICSAVVGRRVYILSGFSSETWEYFTDVLCFNSKNYEMNVADIPPLPFGISKAAAVALHA